MHIITFKGSDRLRKVIWKENGYIKKLRFILHNLCFSIMNDFRVVKTHE